MIRFRRCKVRRRSVEVVEVAGPMDMSLDVVKRLIDEGFRVVRRGPYTDRKIHPRVDPHRFLCVAEREITPPQAVKTPGPGDRAGGHSS